MLCEDLERYGQHMSTTEPTKLSRNDARYPATLLNLFGSLLPPDIWVAGNVSLLGEKAVGFCGSRKASDRGLEVAADCARQLSEAGVIVVSGYAPGGGYGISRGRAQKWGAYDHCAPRGINHFRIKKTVKSLLDWERILVVSQFPRDAIWRADRAMERNKVIVALSRAVIVLEAREQGGTLNAGYSALQLGKPLFVALYDEPSPNARGVRKCRLGQLTIL